MKKKLYIETSVWNQLEHTDRPDWRETTERFFAAASVGHYELLISNVVIDEILATSDSKRQKRLVAQINRMKPEILALDNKAAVLTRHYIEAGFGGPSVSQRVYRDCSHVAVATVNNIRQIVSFNCKHLVNDRRIDCFNAINLQNGYNLTVDISTPHKFLDTSGWEIPL